MIADDEPHGLELKVDSLRGDVRLVHSAIASMRDELAEARRGPGPLVWTAAGIALAASIVALVLAATAGR